MDPAAVSPVASIGGAPADQPMAMGPQPKLGSFRQDVRKHRGY
jgi:hypothetical protein